MSKLNNYIYLEDFWKKYHWQDILQTVFVCTTIGWVCKAAGKTYQSALIFMHYIGLITNFLHFPHVATKVFDFFIDETIEFQY